MGFVDYGKVLIHGNFEEARRYKTKDGRPRDSWDRDYKAIIPFSFSWRVKWCGVECDCKEIIECYQPYYGRNWRHMDDCAMMQLYKKHPTWANVADYPPAPAVEPD